jgi:hypothetical protein
MEAVDFDRLVREKELQKTVEETLSILGYLWFHDRSLSYATVRATNPGFPDLCAVHPTSGALVFIELKSQTGKMRPEQILWADALSSSPAIYMGPVRPAQLVNLIRRLEELSISQ